jgi:hypothetical protein
MVPQADEKSGKTNGSLSLLTPLEPRAMLSPDIRQRVYAAAKLAKWNKGASCGEIFKAPLVASGNLYEIGVLEDNGRRGRI